MSEESDAFEKFAWLREYARGFEVDADDIEVISTPDQFYQTLKSQLSKCTKRTVISSLYLGSGQLEKELVNTIESALSNNGQQQRVRVKMLLDYSRHMRPGERAREFLAPLLRRFATDNDDDDDDDGERRFRLSLYHTSRLRGLAKRLVPQRTNETFGVLHMKIYIVDDDLIISGANLSNDYFTNRQDRYLVLRNCAALCDHLESLVDALSEFSATVNSRGEPVWPSHWSPRFGAELGKRVRSLIAPPPPQSPSSSSSSSSSKQKGKTLVYPLVQISEANVRVDEQVTRRVLETSARQESSCSIHLAVGYFNLPSEYARAIVEASRARYQILVASPHANGFYRSAGFTANVPLIYSHLAKSFLDSVHSRQQDERVTLLEYQRADWTFHAKGLWFYPGGSQLPSMTIVGSSNFGMRSVARDPELQLLIHTDNKSLQHRLDQERKDLFQHNVMPLKHDSFTGAVDNRLPPFWLKMFSRMFRSYF